MLGIGMTPSLYMLYVDPTCDASADAWELKSLLVSQLIILKSFCNILVTQIPCILGS